MYDKKKAGGGRTVRKASAQAPDRQTSAINSRVNYGSVQTSMQNDNPSMKPKKAKGGKHS